MLNDVPFFSIERYPRSYILDKYLIDQDNKMEEIFMEHNLEELELQNIPAAKTMKIGTSLESYLIDHIVMQDQSLFCLTYLKQRRIS
jgi:hypothetical protein